MLETEITFSDHVQEALQQFAERQNMSVDQVITYVSTVLNNCPDDMTVLEWLQALSDENQVLKRKLQDIESNLQRILAIL